MIKSRINNIINTVKNTLNYNNTAFIKRTNKNKYKQLNFTDIVYPNGLWPFRYAQLASLGSLHSLYEVF